MADFYGGSKFLISTFKWGEGVRKLFLGVKRFLEIVNVVTSKLDFHFGGMLKFRIIFGCI